MDKYDFSGYATRNDLKCSDGRVIRHGAFKECDGKIVPLVWQHRHDTVDNVLGHALLEHRDDGMYTYGVFNDTPAGKTAKDIVKHGDVTSLSIYANKLVQHGSDVLHGAIREVSLVLAGANPGAFIENVSIMHSDGFEEILEDELVIRSGETIEHAEKETENMADNEVSKETTAEEPSGNTVAEVFDTLNDEQLEAVYAVVGSLMEEAEAGDGELAQAAIDIVDDSAVEALSTLTHAQEDAVAMLISSIIEDQEGSEMKHNVFDSETDNTAVLSHSDMEAIFADAQRMGSLKDAALEHGITDIEVLFPEAQMVGGGAPAMVSRRMEWVGRVIGGVRKSPFSRIKSTAANVTQEEARARGYIKGKQKIEEQISALKRVTTPQTIYKLQKLDRDDIIDITDFDVVAWMKSEMRMMLDEELARAILVGDGRLISDESKIQETNIRPIWSDDEVYAVHTVMANNTKTEDFIDEIIRAKKQYRGSGRPTMFVGTDTLTEMRLLKDADGYRRYKTDRELADDLRVAEIVEVELFDGLTRQVNGKERKLGAIIVNLSDYTVGANKGGEVTLFDDFDLNYNKYEYLIETRCCGALYQPKSALVFEFAESAIKDAYKKVADTSSKNPFEEGYYEKDGMLYRPTTDTTAKPGKDYFELA